MTMFEDWAVEYDPNIYTKALALKGQATIRAMTVAKAFIDIPLVWENGIRESVRKGIELTPDQLRNLLLTDPQKQRALAATGRLGQKLVDSEIKKIWTSAEKTVAAADTAEELARSEAEYTASRRAFGAAIPETQISEVGQQMLKLANEQEKTYKLLREQNNKAQNERWAADKAFFVEAGMVSGEAQAAAGAAPTPLQKFTPTRFEQFTPDVAAASGVAFGPSPEESGVALQAAQRRREEIEAAQAAQAAQAALAATDRVATDGAPLPSPDGQEGDPGARVDDPDKKVVAGTPTPTGEVPQKWIEAGLQGLYGLRLERGDTPEQIDAEFREWERAAAAAGYTGKGSLSQWWLDTYAKPGPDVDDPGGVTTLPPLDPRYLDRDDAAKNALRDRLAAGMPGARELAFEQQKDPTVWSRLGLMGELASDPYTGDPISTAQLSRLGKEGIEDWYYRTVEPRYGFEVAQAGQQRALGLTPEFQVGFEDFALGAQGPGRGRITPEEARRGQQAVIAGLQAPRDVLDPYSQELFSYFEETGGLDDPRNRRLIETLAAPTIRGVSPRHRPGVTARIQQELINLGVTQPEQQMLSFFTGKPAMRPEYQPTGGLQPLAGDFGAFVK